MTKFNHDAEDLIFTLGFEDNTSVVISRSDNTLMNGQLNIGGRTIDLATATVLKLNCTFNTNCNGAIVTPWLWIEGVLGQLITYVDQNDVEHSGYIINSEPSVSESRPGVYVTTIDFLLEEGD